MVNDVVKANDTPAYRVRIAVRNNLLLRAIEKAGFVGHGQLTAFAKSAGVSHVSLGNLVGLRDSPINLKGSFTPLANSVMEALGAAPSDLWTDAQLTMRLKRNGRDVEVSEYLLSTLRLENIEALTLPDPFTETSKKEGVELVHEVLDTVSLRERKVMSMRFGIGCEEHTLDEISIAFGLTRERVRQIEARAIRRMKSNVYGAYQKLLHAYNAIGDGSERMATASELKRRDFTAKQEQEEREWDAFLKSEKGQRFLAKISEERRQTAEMRQSQLRGERHGQVQSA